MYGTRSTVYGDNSRESERRQNRVATHDIIWGGNISKGKTYIEFAIAAYTVYFEVFERFFTFFFFPFFVCNFYSVLLFYILLRFFFVTSITSIITTDPYTEAKFQQEPTIPSFFSLIIVVHHLMT